MSGVDNKDLFYSLDEVASILKMNTKSIRNL